MRLKLGFEGAAMKNFALSWGLIILSALFDSYAAFIVKMKFNELGPIDFSSVQNFFRYMLEFVKSPVLISAIITFTVSPFLWFLALNRIELSVGYPGIVGFHLVFIMMFGIIFLHEALTFQKLIGVLLVAASFFFLQE